MKPWLFLALLLSFSLPGPQPLEVLDWLHASGFATGLSSGARAVRSEGEMGGDPLASASSHALRRAPALRDVGSLPGGQGSR